MLMFFEKLKILKENRLFREIKDRASPQGSKIKLGGREYVNFSSNDYLGLANHPYIINEVKKALDEYGSGSGASRLLSGGSILHKELEDKTAQFKGTESALVFNSGYAANSGIIPAITDKDDIIFSDELNHASIIDGCRLSKAETLIYRHKNLSHLEDIIRGKNAKRKVVITDTWIIQIGTFSKALGSFGAFENVPIWIIHGSGLILRCESAPLPLPRT